MPGSASASSNLPDELEKLAVFNRKITRNSVSRRDIAGHNRAETDLSLLADVQTV